ncbi:hypothetical protein LLH23_18170 [bacterium]|nr:hypothetical protein [bacterium]
MASHPPPTLFALHGPDNITRPEHFGLKGFMLTASVPYRDALSVKGLWAPPYASSDFMLEVRLHGELVPTGDYLWDGNACRREGRLGDLAVQSVLVTPMQRRAAVLQLTVTDTAGDAVTVPVQMAVRGAVDEVSFWEFSGPGCSERDTPWAERAKAWVCEGSREQDARGPSNDMLVKRKDNRALAVATDLPMDRWETLCGHWEGTLSLAPGETRTVHVAMALGPADTAVADCRALVAAGNDGVAGALAEWADCVDDLFTRVPRFAASDERLTRFYIRSLVGLLLNRWRVPEFVTSPYYSTGGINGGCVCCYLWDFGEPWEIMPLHDPEAVKAHIRQFLSVDITQHFAWVPTTGEAFGPWYPVNQEKIIFLIYYYVLFTGDAAFLHETVAGKTVLEWVLFHATYRDDPDQPVALVDYGKGNNHLELRGTFRYDNVLPDLNLRRCANMQAAHELSVLASAWEGSPTPTSRSVTAPTADGELPERAQELAALIKRLMWDPEIRWFHHLDADGRPGTSYNVQMFKPLGSLALDEDETEGLLSHLNETEFLSAWGLHSMSKLDPAYDQVDIDNGGGGNYTAFTPQIIERLYRIGRPEIAEDLLRRILWWGERMPYWGDSIVANQIDYRQDTPLQNTIGALAGAQMVIFGMFGVSVSPEGAITINPQPPSFAPELTLTGLRLRGRCLDITVRAGEFTVTSNGETVVSTLGQQVVLP